MIQGAIHAPSSNSAYALRLDEYDSSGFTLGGIRIWGTRSWNVRLKYLSKWSSTCIHHCRVKTLGMAQCGTIRTFISHSSGLVFLPRCTIFVPVSAYAESKKHLRQWTNLSTTSIFIQFMIICAIYGRIMGNETKQKQALHFLLCSSLLCSAWMLNCRASCAKARNSDSRFPCTVPAWFDSVPKVVKT